MSGGVFDASLDGTTFTVIATIPAYVNEGWNYVDVPSALTNQVTSR